MSTFDYPKLRATADKLIRKFGQSAIIQKNHSVGVDDWNPEELSNDTVVQLVLLDYTNDRSGTVQQGDRKALVSTEGLAIEITPQDKLIVGGETYDIISTMPLSPAGINVLYELQVRL